MAVIRAPEASANYRCQKCGGRIPAGTNYIYVTVRRDANGLRNDMKLCRECGVASPKIGESAAKALAERVKHRLFPKKGYVLEFYA